jgi:type 1 fimbriae regulatory protein FimB/type 1 fimbriae regulatory protein FimE
LLIYRHGLRVSEACDLRWDDIDLAKRTIIVRRLKGSADSAHYLERDELVGLKRLHREQEPKVSYVFVNERGQPFGRMGIARMMERAGEAAKLPFPVHVHMAATFDWIRPGGQGNGHKTPTTLSRARLDYKHGTLHGYVA